MTYVDHKDLPVGTPVHVEFDGEIAASLNHIVVSDGHFIHHVHRNSANVTVTGPKRPDIEEGQLWRAGGENFICMNGGFESVTEAYSSDEEFFNDYPDAKLLVNVDGSVNL